MAREFRPSSGANADSVVLAELARLWANAARRTKGQRPLTQRQLSDRARVPYTTVNSWSTGTSLPRNLDDLVKVGDLLATWAGEHPPTRQDWRQLLGADRSARGGREMGSGDAGRIHDGDLPQLEDAPAVAQLLRAEGDAFAAGRDLNVYYGEAVGPLRDRVRRAGGGNEAAVRAVAERMKVPQLIESFQPRQVQNDVVEKLVAEPAPGRASVVALVGMGGSGKTLLAQAVSCDERIRSRFRHGVIWMRAGSRSPEECQAALLGALGESAPPRHVETGIELLRERMSETQCLLVIDDVNGNDQRLALDVLGPGSAILFTTRNREPVPQARAHLVEVETLSRGEARVVLAAHANAALPEDAGEIGEIIVRCGGLPLALAICGAMTGPDCSWADVAMLLRKRNPAALQATFDDYRHTSLLAAIEASVKGLDEVTRERYQDLAVFADRGPVPVSAAARLWGPQCDAAESLHVIRQLAGRSLLTYRGDDSTFVLHDLLYDYVQYQARGRLTSLHGQFAAAYLDEWGGPESGFPGLDRNKPLDAGTRYGVINVPRHLARAERDDLLHGLLAAGSPGTGGTADAWFAVHDQMGMAAEYLSDLDLAQRHAEQATNRSRSADAWARSFALEIRYALIRSMLVSIARDIPAHVLAELVKRELWPPEKAEAYAAVIPDPASRTDALRALARLCKDKGEQEDQARLVAQARNAAVAINWPMDSAFKVVWLIPLSPEPADREELFDQALQIAEAYRDQVGTFPPNAKLGEVRAWLHARMARYFPERAARELLQGIQAGPSADEYREALTVALPDLQGTPDWQELRDAVLTMAQHSDSRFERAKAIAAIRPFTSPEEQEAITAAAFDFCYRPDEPGEEENQRRWRKLDRVHITPELAQYLPGEEVHRLVAMTLENASAYATIRVLAAVLPRLPDSEKDQAIEAAVDAVRQEGAGIDGETLAAILLAMHKPEAAQLLRETFALMHRERPGNAASLLCDLADARILPPEPFLRQALGPAPSRRILHRLARYLPSDLLLRAATRNLADAADNWAGALVHLAPGLSGPQLSAVLQVVSRARDKQVRVQFLTGLAEYLPADLIGEAAAVAPADAAPWGLAVLLAMLAVRAPDDQRPSLFKRAHDAATSEHFPRTAFQPLITEATDAGQLLAALQLAGSLEGRERARTPAARIPDEPRIPGELIRRALDTARHIDQPCARTQALAALVALVESAERPRVLRDAAEAALRSHPPNDGPCTSLHGLDAAARLVPEPDRIPLSPETASPVVPGEASADRFRQLRCLLAYSPVSSTGQAQQQALRYLAAPPTANLRVDVDDVRLLQVGALAPYLSPAYLAQAARLARKDDASSLAALFIRADQAGADQALKHVLLRDSVQAMHAATREYQLRTPLITLLPHLASEEADTLIGKLLALTARNRNPGSYAETIAQITQAISELPAEPGRVRAMRAIALNRKTDYESQWLPHWRTALNHAADTGQSDLLSLISKIPLPIPGTPPDIDPGPNAAIRYTAEEMLGIRRRWLDDW